jgi:hyperosmotically inducible protein
MSARARSLAAAALAAALLTPAAAAALDLINPLSVVKGAVEHAIEDRSSEDAAADVEIKTKIAAKVIDEMGGDIVSISSDVYEQRVMLTGIVETPEQKTQAGAITRAIEGVKTLYNDLRVIADVDREKGTVEGFVDDTVVETKIDGLLIDAGGVSSRNYRWRSVHGHVYVLGRALSEAEMEKVLAVIRDIEGVQSITDHIEVRPAED